MKITYLGHATFLLESGAHALLIDPYNAQVGYPVPSVRVNTVLVSHDHGDHSNVEMAKGEPRVIRGLADGQWRTVQEQVDGIAISSVPTYHDDVGGAKRGRNTVFVIEAEGLRVVYLADLGHLLSDADAGAIGRPDVLMIPVGGRYTIDAGQAHAVIAQLNPHISIPIHYRTDVNPQSPLATVEEFVAASSAAKHVGHSVTLDKGSVPAGSEVWIMTWK